MAHEFQDARCVKCGTFDKLGETVDCVSDAASFWVIEQFTDGQSQGYWNGGSTRSFVLDINDAMQFRRPIDAQRAVWGWHWTDVEVTEHQYVRQGRRIAEDSRAVKLLRDIVAQWEGAEWCDDAVKFVQAYRPVECDETASDRPPEALCVVCGAPLWCGRCQWNEAHDPERKRHVQRWYEQEQIIRELREELRITVAALKLECANVSAATRSDSVVADGVTLPVGEKPASQEWEPSGKCQYDKCDGTRFDWDSTDSRWGSWFCVKCGGMQIPPSVAASAVREPRCQCGHVQSEHVSACWHMVGDERACGCESFTQRVIADVDAAVEQEFAGGCPSCGGSGELQCGEDVCVCDGGHPCPRCS